MIVDDMIHELELLQRKGFGESEILDENDRCFKLNNLVAITRINENKKLETVVLAEFED
ncbi:MAG: hypothetical protein U9N34_06295 [Candidatus Cloacimonadota bacterium]|nr:hypothetical protein [Candidatus Cloacimonadota bacterium]